MTASLADFIASPQGRMYGAYCERFGEHPGAIFDDDVLKFQAGMGYMLRGQLIEPEPEPEPDDWESAAAANEREWLGG